MSHTRTSSCANAIFRSHTSRALSLSVQDLREILAFYNRSWILNEQSTRHSLAMRSNDIRPRPPQFRRTRARAMRIRSDHVHESFRDPSPSRSSGLRPVIAEKRRSIHLNAASLLHEAAQPFGLTAHHRMPFGMREDRSDSYGEQVEEEPFDARRDDLGRELQQHIRRSREKKGAIPIGRRTGEAFCPVPHFRDDPHLRTRKDAHPSLKRAIQPRDVIAHHLRRRIGIPRSEDMRRRNSERDPLLGELRTERQGLRPRLRPIVHTRQQMAMQINHEASSEEGRLSVPSGRSDSDAASSSSRPPA